MGQLPCPSPRERYAESKALLSFRQAFQEEMEQMLQHLGRENSNLI